MKNRAILFRLVGILCFCRTAAVVSSGQSLKNRVIEKIQERNEPVKIKKIGVKDELVEFGAGKSISYLSFEIFVPEIQSGGDPLLFSLEHGVLPVTEFFNLLRTLSLLTLRRLSPAVVWS